MEKRNIQIDIDTARKWYLSRDSFKQELALQAYTKEELEKPKLPKSWEECLKMITYPTDAIYYRKDCMDNKLDNLSKLLVLRDVYRQGWKPDWNNSSTKYTIEYHFNDIVLDTATNFSCGVFSFPTEKLAEQFLENFKDELEELKELL